jgi:hypothetical protein
MKLTGENRSTWRKTCPSATFSTTNPTWTDPGLNLGLHGDRSATNRLSHRTAMNSVLLKLAVSKPWIYKHKIPKTHILKNSIFR